MSKSRSRNFECRSGADFNAYRPFIIQDTLFKIQHAFFLRAFAPLREQIAATDGTNQANDLLIAKKSHNKHKEKVYGLLAPHARSLATIYQFSQLTRVLIGQNAPSMGQNAPID